MKKGLFPKMVATYSIIIAVNFVIMASILSFWFQGYYFQQRQNQLFSGTPFIKAIAENYRDSAIGITTVSDNLRYISSYLNTDVLLTDSFGIIYAVSNDQYSKFVGSQQYLSDLIDFRTKQSREPKNVDSKLFGKGVHTFLYPIYSNNVLSGAIIMNTEIKGIREPLYKVYEIIWFSALFAVIISCFIIYYFSQKIMIRPLSQINYVAEKISKGEVDKRVNIDTNDEIGELAKSFNSMADSLEQVELNRKRFISNVSHELRSPITSINGFISGILDGIIPKEKENYYLTIVYEEIQRLTRLVNDLLDLSAIESGEIPLSFRQTDINELIRITVIKFETNIKAKKLKVDVSFNEDNLYVIADVDKLIQVLTNLIDNAVKYVNENGRIKVSTKIKSNKVLVQVYNNGPGISEEDLKHIWDRFYKSDKSRTTKNSTGLGLPIVRNILTQFGEDIWVESKEEGVTFYFTVKKA